MNFKICPPMNHEEWLNWRRSGIGASDAPAIMNVSPWKKPLDIWEEKVLGKRDVDSKYKKYGRDMEETARREFEKKFDTILYNFNVENPETSWLHASLDGMDLDKKLMVEIKCSGAKDHATALQKKIPEKYYPQCQHQLMVTGLDGMYYFSFDGNQGAIVEVLREQTYIDSLFEEEETFWASVLSQKPPYFCMKDNEEWNHTAQSLKSIKGQIKALEDEEALKLQYLRDLSEGRSAKGTDAFFQRQECEGAIKYKEAIEDYLSKMRVYHPGIDFPVVPFEAYRKNSFEKWSLKFINKNC